MSLLQQSTYRAHHGSYKIKKEGKKESDTGDTKEDDPEAPVGHASD